MLDLYSLVAVSEITLEAALLYNVVVKAKMYFMCSKMYFMCSKIVKCEICKSKIVKCILSFASQKW